VGPISANGRPVFSRLSLQINYTCVAIVYSMRQRSVGNELKVPDCVSSSASTKLGKTFALLYSSSFSHAMVAPDGSARQVADNIAFPNGMVVTPENSTLIVAESYASRLTAFDIAAEVSRDHEEKAHEERAVHSEVEADHATPVLGCGVVHSIKTWRQGI